MFMACVMCVYGVCNVLMMCVCMLCVCVCVCCVCMCVCCVCVCVCCVRVYVYAGTRCMYDGF